MHIPKKFQQDNSEQLRDIICKYPLATLVTYSGSGVEANHIPFILDQSGDKQLLQGHIAKVNDLWKNVPDKSDVLLIFHGPNCYVSPNYYPTKKEHGKAVPTWNYVTVHVKGTMSYIHDEQWNMNMINKLTSQHEATQPKPWSTSDAPEEYIRKMLPAIVGLEVEILSIEGQWKLSQNQPEKNQQGVVEGLLQEGDADSGKIAKLVQKHFTH